MGKREIWFKWKVGEGGTILQRSNKQGIDQGDGENKAETLGFYVFSKHMIKYSAPKVPRCRQDEEYGRVRGIETLCYRDENVELLGWYSP